MSSSERRAVTVLLLLGALGCPEPVDPASLLVPLPPLTDAGGPLFAAPIAAPADAGLPAPARVETLDAIVFEFGGKAEVRRAGAEDWVELAVGDAVRVDDEVRTSPDGHLEMRFGAARVQVHEGSELTLKFLEARAIRAEVRGLASGDAADGGELTFEGRGTGVVAVARGQLSLDANERRSVASSTSGGARLTSGGSTVDVKAGEQAIAQGASLSRSGKIPKKVSLSVSGPSQLETNQPTVVLKGRASPYARVLVAGQRVEPAADGAFEAKVALKRGSQSIWIVAIDPLGRRKTEKRQITFDPNAPTVSGKVEYR